MTETEFVETVKALRNVDAQIAALDASRGLLRGALVDHFGKPAEKVSADAEGVRVTWHPPTTTEKLDRSLLVQAGVTPEQLKKGTMVGKKAGYLDVRKLAPEDAE